MYTLPVRAIEVRCNSMTDTPILSAKKQCVEDILDF